MDYFNILFQPKGFSSRHSLVQKSEASPLDLGIVWTGPKNMSAITSLQLNRTAKKQSIFYYDVNLLSLFLLCFFFLLLNILGLGKRCSC